MVAENGSMDDVTTAECCFSTPRIIGAYTESRLFECRNLVQPLPLGLPHPSRT